MTCHVLGDNPTDAKLAEAGHPDGADFHLAVKFKPVALHWIHRKTSTPRTKSTQPAAPSQRLIARL